MLTFFRSLSGLQKGLLIGSVVLVVLALIATYQWGYINGEKTKKP